MIADLKRYPVMKESGVPWLGEVPEHWVVRPNRAIFDEVRERDHPEAQLLSVTITKGIIRQAALLEDASKKDGSNQDKSPYKLVRPGDIVYNKMRAWQGAIGVSEYEGIVSPAYVVQRPRAGAEPRYLHYLLRTPGFAKEAERWSYGITSDMWSLRPEHFRLIYSCLPPAAEQGAIVRFLDHADRQIQRYIRTKQKLIKLLEEQKQALVHRFITRGLDPDVRLKPAGIEWVGDIPEHWQTSRLKFVARQIVDCLHATPVYSEDGVYPAIRTADVRPGELLLDSARRVDDEHYRLWTSRLAPTAGDVLYTREGERFGIAALVPPNAQVCISQRMMVFRIEEKQNPAYIMWQINCQHVYAQAAAHLIGAAAPHVNVARIKNFALILPPPIEQIAIASAIEQALRHPVAAIRKARDEIELLRDYRTRLIADVVTGKVDVREAAAFVTKDAHDADPFDDAEDLCDVDDVDSEGADLEEVEV